MTETALFMSVSFLPTFIEAYKSHPCLWHRKGKDYTNKPIKEAAYKSLVGLTKQVIPDCTIDVVKKKIDVIRGCFRKEMHKVRRSETAGTRPYVPKLWYFKMLLFLTSQDEEADEEWDDEAPVGPSVTKADPDQDPPVGGCGLATDDEPERGRSGGAQAQVLVPYGTHFYEEGSFLQAPQHDTATDYGKKRLRDEKFDEYLRREDIVPFFDHKEDEYDKVGGNVAAKLRKMEPSQRLYAEHLINEVLFKGMLSKLSENSSVQTFN